jgi:hypothetical protein
MSRSATIFCDLRTATRLFILSENSVRHRRNGLAPGAVFLTIQARRGTINLAVRRCSTSFLRLRVRLRTVPIPRSGMDREGLNVQDFTFKLKSDLGGMATRRRGPLCILAKSWTRGPAPTRGDASLGPAILSGGTSGKLFAMLNQTEADSGIGW